MHEAEPTAREKVQTWDDDNKSQVCATINPHQPSPTLVVPITTDAALAVVEVGRTIQPVPTHLQTSMNVSEPMLPLGRRLLPCRYEDESKYAKRRWTFEQCRTYFYVWVDYAEGFVAASYLWVGRGDAGGARVGGAHGTATAPACVLLVCVDGRGTCAAHDDLDHAHSIVVLVVLTTLHMGDRTSNP